MTDNNGKLRAVFLAALMVLWVFAGTMAFAGSAAAVDNAEVTVDSVTPADSTPDAQTTYDVTITTDNDTTVGSVALDFSDAGGSGDVSQLGQDDVTYSVDGGATVENISNLNVNGQTLEITLNEQEDVMPADDLEIYLGDNDQINNPYVGTYTLTATAYHEGSLQGTSQQSSVDYQIGGAEQAGADGTWDSGATRWQGQSVYFSNSSDAGSGLSDFQLREWDDSATEFGAAVGDLEREFSVGDNNERVLSSDNLEGDYVITASNGSERVAVITNSDGVVEGTTGNTSGTPEVEFALQNADAQFADDTVQLGDSTTLEVDSNRNNYDVVISSDNLTQTQLLNVFPNSEVSGSSAVTVTGVDSAAEISAEFTEANDIEEGDNYEFTVEAADTTASDNASISIGQPSAADVSFDQSQFSDQRGDIVTISATSEELDRFNLTLGGSNVNYEATFEVEPNDDGEVAIAVNTFALARTNDQSVIYTAEKGTVANFTQTRDDRSRVLEAALYDVTADQHSADADGEPQEFDVAVVSLEERSSPSMTVHTAPYSQFSQVQDREGIVEGIDEGTVTESDTIAIKDPSRDDDIATRGDTIVHAVDVSGLEGAFSPGAGNNLQKLQNASDAGLVNVTLTQQEAGINEDPIVLDPNDLSSTNTVVVDDLENDTLYVVVRPNTLVDDLNAETGDEFVAEYNSTAMYENNFSEDAEDQTANDSFTLVDREATFDTQNGEVRVSPTEDAEIAGTTTVAPGTELTIRARATGESPFLRTSPATVDADGNFAGTFDFSDISEGQNFTASIQRQSFEDSVETAGVVGELETAGVSISDQEYTGQADEIVVDSAFLPEGGFVTIHDGSLLDGATFDSVRGTSDYLSEGENTDVTVTLDTPYTEDGTAIAMPHQDTNGNQEYDFVSSEGAEDSPYADANGSAITASASVTISEETATATEAPETETEAPETETEAPETDTETPAEEQPGFGAVIALIALLGAALLAARRNAF